MVTAFRGGGAAREPAEVFLCRGRCDGITLKGVIHRTVIDDFARNPPSAYVLSGEVSVQQPLGLRPAVDEDRLTDFQSLFSIRQFPAYNNSYRAHVGLERTGKSERASQRRPTELRIAKGLLGATGGSLKSKRVLRRAQWTHEVNRQKHQVREIDESKDYMNSESPDENELDRIGISSSILRLVLIQASVSGERNFRSLRQWFRNSPCECVCEEETE